MPHKSSCRSCGTFLTPKALCNVCKEHISWICSRCNKMEDVTHVHTTFILQICENV